MNVRALTPNELLEFDNGLTLFRDTEWDFSRVFNKQTNNFSYFDTVADLAEVSRWGGFWAIVKTSVPFIALTASCCMFAYNKLVVPNDYQMYLDSLKTIQTDEAQLIVNYKAGVEASDDELIAVSKLMSGYYNASIYDLSSFCIDGSAVVNEYKSAIDSMENIHDSGDMRSRYISSTFEDFDLIKIDKLIIGEDGNYYCYCLSNRPTGKSVEDYVLTNAYNYTKKFSGGGFTDADLIEYTLNLKETEPMITERGVDCIVLAKDSLGNFQVADDSEIISLISDSYTSLLQQLNKIIQKFDE